MKRSIKKAAAGIAGVLALGGGAVVASPAAAYSYGSSYSSYGSSYSPYSSYSSYGSSYSPYRSSYRSSYSGYGSSYSSRSSRYSYGGWATTPSRSSYTSCTGASCYGTISRSSGRARTRYVGGYFRSNGTYVGSYYRSR